MTECPCFVAGGRDPLCPLHGVSERVLHALAEPVEYTGPPLMKMTTVTYAENPDDNLNRAQRRAKARAK